MTLPYDQLLRYVFKRFSVLSAFRTALPTARYLLTRPALPPSDKPALFTMNILPPMMTVWHHLARKNLGDKVDITIFDCSGRLDTKEFPGARVQKYLNLYAATKSDEFLTRIARNRRIGWICDDDVFFTGGNPLDLLQREFRDPNTASVSFRPRDWWHFDFGNGVTHPASGSYCIAYNREIFVEKEHLSLKPADGNTHPSRIGKNERRYDTADKANEILLRKGYRCAVLPKEEASSCISAFTGMSGAVMLLWYFRTPDQTLEYFRTAPAERWNGNVLYGLLAGMLAIRTIQECHETLKGRPYPLPSLPARTALERLRQEHAAQFREDQTFDWVDETTERLRAAL
jgi:hypothetical protein